MSDLIRRRPESDWPAPLHPFKFAFDLDHWLDDVQQQLWGTTAGFAGWVEHEDRYELELELPEGFRQEDLQLTLDHGLVRVHGRHTPREGWWARTKRFFTRKSAAEQREYIFDCSATFPYQADPCSVEAEWSPGVLKLRAQKQDAYRPRRIPVR